MRYRTPLVWAALLLAGCAPEEFADETVSSESNITSARAACPTEAPITQGFHGGHDGVDLGNKIGTPIYAVAAGVVTDSGPAQGYGQWIRIRHDDGSMTESGHMSRRDVKVGDRVRAGQQIALMGSEGQSTGPHLHLRTYASAARTGSGNGMNPVEFLRARGVTLPCRAGAAAAPASAAPENSEDTSLPVLVTWNGLTGSEASLDVVLKDGRVIGPCVGVDVLRDEYRRKISDGLGYVFTGACVTPGITPKSSDIDAFQLCTAENDDWARATCTSTKWNHTRQTVKIENCGDECKRR